MKKSIYTILSLAVFGFTACTDDYFEDTGIHSREVELTPYDYLAAHPAHLFDTLLLVVDHLGLKEEINSAKTLFGVTNFSTSLLMRIKQDADPAYTFDDLLAELTADDIRAYLYDETIERLGTPTEPRRVMNRAGDDNFAVLRTEPVNKEEYLQWGTTVPEFLYLISIRGALDPISGPIPGDTADVRFLCQTSDILCTPTGTVIHVLNNRHTFTIF